MRAALLGLLLISQFAVLVAIVRRGLVRPFLFFFLYVLVLFLRQLRLGLLDRGDPYYLQFWALTLGILIPLQILATGESLYRSLEQFRGMRIGVFSGAVAVAIIVATWLQDLQTRHTHFGMLSQADQAVSTTLFLSGAAISLSLSWINPERRHNALLHERLLLLHLGTMAGCLFALHHGQTWVNTVSILCTAANFFAWVWLVRNNGELRPAPSRKSPLPAAFPST